jgi:histidyl-tRNA synthetase
MSRRLWRELDIPMPTLEINSLGEAESRARFREKLVAYLENYRGDLDPDSQRRLTTNPLRILDSKNARTQEILRDGPELSTGSWTVSPPLTSKACSGCWTRWISSTP